jgi:signal transduction histidine kinase
MAIAGAGAIALAACGYSANVPAALIVVLYTFAAGAGGARIWPPIAFAALLYATQVAFEIAEISVSIEDYAFPALLLAGAWVLGDRHRTASQRRAEAHERREREERLSIAEERTRIARELHDSAGHAINTILVQAGAARVLRERDPERSWEAIEAIERLARGTIEDIDRIVGSLRAGAPAELAPLPGIERIPDLVADLRRAGLEVELRERADDWRLPPPAVDRAAYRIAQEALTNAARHGSGRAELTLHQHVDRLELTVVNRLVDAPAPTRSGGGLGLVGMRERAQLLGGSFEAGPEDGRFRVHAVFPYGWVRGERKS